MPVGQTENDASLDERSGETDLQEDLILTRDRGPGGVSYGRLPLQRSECIGPQCNTVHSIPPHEK